MSHPHSRPDRVLRLQICVSIWVALGIVGAVLVFALHPMTLAGGTLLAIGAVGIGAVVTAWATNRVPHLLLLGVSVALSLTVAEAYLHNTMFAVNRLRARSDHDRLFQYDATLGWRFISGAEESVLTADYERSVRINSEGFHDVEPPREAEADQRLVAVFGDSFTSNIGVAVDEVFTSGMNERLGPNTITKNFGVNGYGQVQELLLLENVLERQRPDVALVVVYWRNDLDDNGGQFDWLYPRPKAERTLEGLKIVTAFPEPPDPTKPVARSRSFLNRVRSLALVRIIKLAMGRFGITRVHRSVLPRELRYGAIPLDDRDAEAVEVTKALLDEIAREASESGVPLGFVFAPSLWQVETERWNDLLDEFSLDPAEYSRSQPQAYLLKHCAVRHWNCLDLQFALRQHTAAGEKLYYPREQHWTKDGNARVAEAISAWLVEQQFLEDHGAP